MLFKIVAIILLVKYENYFSVEQIKYSGQVCCAVLDFVFFTISTNCPLIFTYLHLDISTNHYVKLSLSYRLASLI